MFVLVNFLVPGNDVVTTNKDLSTFTGVSKTSEHCPSRRLPLQLLNTEMSCPKVHGLSCSLLHGWIFGGGMFLVQTSLHILLVSSHPRYWWTPPHVLTVNRWPEQRMHLLFLPLPLVTDKHPTGTRVFSNTADNVPATPLLRGKAVSSMTPKLWSHTHFNRTRYKPYHEPTIFHFHQNYSQCPRINVRFCWHILYIRYCIGTYIRELAFSNHLTDENS